MKWLEKYKSLLIFGGLVFGGVVLHFLHAPPWAWHWIDQTREMFGHALIVAGLLGGTVDTILKAQLIRDVGSLFVGWALPQEVRDHIRHVSQASIVRRNEQIHYVLREVGPDIFVDVTHDADVYNYSIGVRSYRPRLALDRFENPDEDAVSLEVTTGRKTTRWDAAQLNGDRRREVNSQLIRWHCPKSFWLVPQRLDETTPACHVRWTHRLRVPRDFSTVASFAYPTIGVTITSECPSSIDFDCKATEQMQHAIGSNRWFHPKLFFGSHLRIYWRSKQVGNPQTN